MCSCGKFTDAYYAGCRRGHYEQHSADYCYEKELNTWRRRIFVPIAEFFDRLAGAFSSKALDELYLDMRTASLSRDVALRNAGRRKMAEEMVDRALAAEAK